MTRSATSMPVRRPRSRIDSPGARCTASLAENRPPWRLSISTKVLAAVNVVLLVGLALVLVIDYRRGLADRLREKWVAMGEEAALVLPAVSSLSRNGLQPVQGYIDRACAHMQETVSPGHHIAVRIGDTVLQAQTHQRASPAFAHAMQLAAAAADHRARVGGRPILVGTRGDDDVRVYVSEFTTNIRRAAKAQLLSRAGGTALVGLALTAIVNLILLRLVKKPIDGLVHTVRRIGGGEFGVAPPHFTTTELDYLASEIGEMSRSLAAADRTRQRQMRKARQIQQHLLPPPDHLRNVGIHHVHLPAEDVGGDFFDIKIIDDHRLAIYMGDVTGHGVPAAMTAGMLKTLFENGAAEPDDPTSVLSRINRRFHAVTLVGDFATMFMGVIDRREGRLLYASAGHEIGYLLRESGQVMELSPTGLLLGVDPDAHCELVHVDTSPGDMIVLLTDGLVETRSPDGAVLGRKAILEALEAARGRPGPEVADRLLQLADAHRGDQPQHDDITLAVLRV